MKHPYVSRIEIRNFRNFRELTVDLAPTAVFVGQNKAGKSNLIEAMRLIFDPSLPDSARHLRAEDFWDGLKSPFAGETIEVKAFIRDFEDNGPAKALLADCIVTPKPLTALVTYQYRPRETTDNKQTEKSSEEDYEFVIFGGKNEENAMGYDLRRWLALVVLPALRDAQTDLQSWRKSPLRPLLDRVRKQIKLEELEAVRKDLDEAKAELLDSPAVKALVDALNERLAALAGPMQAVKTDLDFAPSEPEQLFRALRIYIDERTTKPLADASLGTANMLFLALLLQDLELKREAKEIVSTVMAIEEPEAHLHPQLQRLLFRYFLSRDHPIFLTTHSPNIASVAPLSSTVLLRVINGESQAFSAHGVEFSDEEIADLQRYLDVTRAEILFARGIVLVEGMAEQFLVTAFAERHLREKKIGSSLDDLGLLVCAVGGTDFAPYWRLLSEKGFAIPCVTITDGDPRPNQDKETVWHGIVRGKKLIADKKTRDAVTAHLEKNDPKPAIAMLAKENIFVGQRTLEVDLLSSMAEEMTTVFAALRDSEKATNRFKEFAGKALKDADAADSMVERIERLGKGRFAQRLASQIGKKAAPSYIAQAIERIVGLVQLL